MYRLQMVIAALLLTQCLPDQHVLLSPLEAAELSFPLTASRILFLGDSNTHAGEFVSLIDTQLRLQALQPRPEILNLGLSSETCTGLSEPDHPFPRPDVHERLERALSKIRPDVVVACYGMNDGIYHPFSDERFAAFQQGILRLIEKVHAAGARIVLLTPPPFDRLQPGATGKLLPSGQPKYAWFAPYEHYDSEVISRYAKWILELGDRADLVIDLHGPLTEVTRQRREKDAGFTMAPDGVHFTSEGHRIVAATILKAWGIESAAESSTELDQLMRTRTALLHDAWLSEVGHLRPGVAAGLPLDQARAEAEKLDQQIAPLVKQLQKN